MAYGYLLAPSFQFVNINGRPIANGHIEVFLTNTDTKYITKCDFNGTDNPFKVPLNSKGMAVVIASGDYAYDVFCYDRFGSLFWSGSNIRIEGATGVVIDGANLPLRIVGGKIDNNGKELTCTGENAWAEGAETTASGANAHAEGGQTTASGEHSHSEGFRTTASSGYCHAEGAGSKASNTASHAEGQDTTSSGQASHAEGRGSVASGDYSHASGRGTRATGEGSTAVGKWNDDGDALFVVGGGNASNNRKDVFKVDRNGDTWVLVNNSLVRVNNCSQFVLTRSNMTTAFTNDEYSDCVNSVTNGIAVCVQVGTSLQLQLTQIDSLGIHFDATFGDYHYTYVVAPTTNAHTISENIRHFGTPIYATLQDAISDADALHVGMYFETNGFRTSGDGGSARYIVSTSGTANGMDIVSIGGSKKAILQIVDTICPEQYGAYGDDTHDDTLVFDYIINNASIKFVKLLENKTYKIQFKNWTLTNKTILGCNKDTSRLSQASTNLNKPLFTLGTNCNVGNMTIVCGGGNTIRTGLFHFGNDEGGTFRPFIGTHIHDIHAYCINNIIGVDISYSSNGSYNLKIEHCKFDSAGIGIRISNLGDTINQSYISDFYFEDILVDSPYSYGLEIDRAQTGGMMISHGLISQFSVQLKRDGSCGFKLSYGDFSLINPTAFIENTSGVVYSLELDFFKIYPSNLQNGIISCFGGILEGIIKNKNCLNKISWKDTDFVEEEKFSDNLNGIRPTSRHLITSPVSVYHKNAEQSYSSCSLTNGTKSFLDNEFGQVIEVGISDFNQTYTTIDFPIILPKQNYITAELLLLYTNSYEINENTSTNFPELLLVDSNNNIIQDSFGISLSSRYGRITMDSDKIYYGLNSSFDLSNADRNATWYLRLKIPTEFSSSLENAKVNILGLNLFIGYVAISDLSLKNVRNEEWYEKERIKIISQNVVGGTSGQWLTFTFSQVKFTKLAFLSFTAKNIVLSNDEDLLVNIMSGDTIIRSYTMSLKAGTHTIEVSVSTGGVSYTPKLSLTSSNSRISSGTYTCYVQGIAY